MIQRTLETATLRRARETREVNPFERVRYSATADRFSILRLTGDKRAVYFGSYDTLQEAIEARDTLPAFMRLNEKFRLKENEE